MDRLIQQFIKDIPQGKPFREITNQQLENRIQPLSSDQENKKLHLQIERLKKMQQEEIQKCREEASTAIRQIHSIYSQGNKEQKIKKLERQNKTLKQTNLKLKQQNQELSVRLNHQNIAFQERIASITQIIEDRNYTIHRLSSKVSYCQQLEQELRNCKQEIKHLKDTQEQLINMMNIKSDNWSKSSIIEQDKRFSGFMNFLRSNQSSLWCYNSTRSQN